MNKYKALTVLEVEVEAPSTDDAEEIIDDYLGVGRLGECINVITITTDVRRSD